MFFMEEKYNKIIQKILLLIIFLIPLFIWRGIYDVFSFDKITLLRIFTLIILAVLGLKIITRGYLPEINLRKFSKDNYLNLPILAFFIISALATIFSINPWISILGFYKRYEGLSTLFIYLILFFVTINFAGGKKFQKKILWVICLVVLLSSFYGILQDFKLDPFGWQAEFPLARIFSTFGNPNFFSAYLAISFPILLYLFLIPEPFEKENLRNLSRKERRKKERELRKKREKEKSNDWEIWLSGIAIVLSYVCILITLTRAAILALGGILIFFFLAGWQFLLSRKKRLAVLFLVLSLITLWKREIIFQRFIETIGIAQARTEEVQVLPKEEKINQAANIKKEEKILGTTTSLGDRLYIWRKTIEIIKDYPFLGIGPDAMALVYWPYEKIEDICSHRSLVDRAHNDFLDMAVTRGIPGLFSYLWILGAIFLTGIKIIKKTKKNVTERIYSGSLLGGISAYLIQNQFSFGVSAISSLFWILMALLVLENKRINKEEKKLNDNKEDKIKMIKTSLQNRKTIKFLTIPFFLIIIFLFIFTIKLTIADFYYKQGQIAKTKKEIDRAIEMHRKATRFSPWEAFYQEGVSLSVYEKAAEAPDEKEKINWLKKTIEETEKALKLNPYNGFFYNTMGVCYSSLSRLEKREENEKKAADYYKKAIQLTPKLTEAYNNLSLILIKQEKLDEAKEIIERAFVSGKGAYDTETVAYQLGKSLLDKKEIAKAIGVFENVVKWLPTNATALQNLGVVYTEAGKNKEAKEIFEKVLEIDPNNETVKQALKIL